MGSIPVISKRKKMCTSFNQARINKNKMIPFYWKLSTIISKNHSNLASFQISPLLLQTDSRTTFILFRPQFMTFAINVSHEFLNSCVYLRKRPLYLNRFLGIMEQFLFKVCLHKENHDVYRFYKVILMSLKCSMRFFLDCLVSNELSYFLRNLRRRFFDNQIL